MHSCSESGGCHAPLRSPKRGCSEVVLPFLDPDTLDKRQSCVAWRKDRMTSDQTHTKHIVGRSELNWGPCPFLPRNAFPTVLGWSGLHKSRRLLLFYQRGTVVRVESSYHTPQLGMEPPSLFWLRFIIPGATKP